MRTRQHSQELLAGVHGLGSGSSGLGRGGYGTTWAVFEAVQSSPCGAKEAGCFRQVVALYNILTELKL